MSVWDSIREALAAGEDPVVYLSYSMLSTIVRPEPPKRRGPVPKKRGIVFSLYGKTPMAGRKTYTFRCWNPYCRKRITGRYVCDEQCKALATEHLQTALTLLHDGKAPSEPVEDVPDVPIFDSEGRDRNALARTAGGKGRDPRGRKPKGYRGGQPPARDRAARETLALLGESLRQGKETG